MDKAPLITCFLLTYNKFQYIYEALESILNQTYPHIELAVFDDGSDCFPQEDIEQYIEKHKKENIERIIIYRSPENQGTVKNINNVIRKTHGKYLFGAGIDDILYDDCVFEKAVSFFEETGAYAITCYKEVIDEAGKTIKIAPAKQNAERIRRASAEDLFKMVAMGIAIAGAGTYYSRKIFEEIGMFDEAYRLQEDGPFFLRMLRSGYKIQFADFIAVKYRLGNGISSSAELHPALKKDINQMLQNEIKPYLNRFTFWEKRRISYQLERFSLPKQLTILQKMQICLKYPDVVVYRKIMAS